MRLLASAITTQDIAPVMATTAPVLHHVHLDLGKNYVKAVTRHQEANVRQVSVHVKPA